MPEAQVKGVAGKLCLPADPWVFVQHLPNLPFSPYVANFIMFFQTPHILFGRKGI